MRRPNLTMKEVINMDHRIHQLQQQHALPLPSVRKPAENKAKDSFKDVLAGVQDVKISKHAKARLNERNIDINDNQWQRSEEHTSELQSRFDLVCRLLLEKKKK